MQTTDTPQRPWLRHLYAGLSSLQLLLALLLLNFILLASPSIFSGIYDTLGFKESYSVHSHRIVSTLWQPESDFADLPRIGRLFHPKEVKHYEDVRTILQRCLILLGVTTALLLIQIRWIPWRLTLWYTTGTFIAIALSLVIWGLIDWKHLFTTLHWWLFQNDSWRLPKGCISLILYPYKVWQTTGAIFLISLLAQLLLPLGIHSLYKRMRFKSQMTPTVS